jgi:DNA-binding CsgD family transcriptional regulator
VNLLNTTCAIPPLTGLRSRVFWSRIRRTTTCWLWQGGQFVSGYGQFSINGRGYLAHRVAFARTKGCPDGQCVCHSCDNRLCCNPDHLFLGTIADNNRDMVSKGRDRKACGASAGKAKLTEAEVHGIRKSNESSRQLGRRLGVSHTTINQIRNGSIWRHLV